MKIRRTGLGGVAVVGVGLLAMVCAAGPGPGQARVQVPRGEEAHVQDDDEDGSNLDDQRDGDPDQRGADES